MHHTDTATARAIRTLQQGDIWTVKLTDVSSPNIRVTQHSRRSAVLSCTIGVAELPKHDADHTDSNTRGLPDVVGQPSQWVGVALVGGELCVNILCQAGGARVEVESY